MSLIATVPEGKQKQMTLYEGEWLNVKVLLQGTLYTFQSQILKLYDAPTTHVHLSLPNDIEHHEIRQWQRITIYKMVEVTGESEFSNGKTQAMVMMVNISTGGVLLETSIHLGSIGAKVSMKGLFRMGMFEKELIIPGIIRKILIKEDKLTGDAYSQHGVEFILDDFDQADKVMLYGYVYEQVIYAYTRKLV
jgi:c-di-GMP-binding flagellar brake protein YcgR